MKKPITPAAHGIIDYLFAAALMVGPKLFKLTGLARTLSYGFGSGVTAYGAMTDHPVGMQRKSSSNGMHH